MRNAVAFLLLGPLAACAGGGGEDFPDDRTPPELEITTPARGTMTDSTSLTVSGQVVDSGSGVQEVTVNGERAEVAADGSFSIALEVPQTITFLETAAVDAAGNESSDVRAVLAGTLVEQAAPVTDGIAARVSSAAMGGLGDMISDLANETDWTALAKSQNPVAGSGGTSCNSYQAYVDAVSHGGITVGSGAVEGGIAGDFEALSLVVEGHIDFRALCVGGSTSYTITADAYELAAVIAPRLEGDALTVSLEDVTNGFENFQINVSGVPGFVESHFRDRVRDELAAIIREKVIEIAPPLANDFLAEFLSDAWTISVLGQTVNLSIRPSDMSWTAAGGEIALDTAAYVDGLEGARYLKNPQPRPNDGVMASEGLKLAVADDAINQLLSAIWASGAFEETPIPATGGLSSVLGTEVESATIDMLLPPVAHFDGDAESAVLRLGDVIVDVTGAGGETLARFVMMAEIELSVEERSDGRVKITTGTPRVLAQVLDQSPSLLTELDDAKVAAIGELAIRQLASSSDDLLASVPLPGLSNATIELPSFRPALGYFLVDGKVTF